MILTVISAVYWNGSLQADVFSDKQYELNGAIQQRLSNEELSLLYLSCGYSNLISKNYKNSLDDYQKALNILAASKNPGIEFLISFGMMVACDHLHLSRDTQQHALRIRELVDASEEENDINKSFFEDECESARYLKHIAGMSASPQVQDALNSFVAEIFPTLLASYSYSSLDGIARSSLSCKSAPMAKPCRSFWKTLKKIRNEIVDTWNKLFSIYKDIKEIKNDFRENQAQV